MNSAKQHSPHTVPAALAARTEHLAMSGANISARTLCELNVAGWSRDTDFDLGMGPVGKSDASAESFEPCTYVMQMAPVQY